MGSQAFDKSQLRLAWVGVLSVVSWLYYYTVVVPGEYARMDGNTRRLILEHTEYTTYMGFAYGDHATMMYVLTVLPLLVGAIWLYRGHQDDWDFLYA